MKDAVVDQFQYSANELLIRNRSIIDLITKFQDSNSRVNRDIVKAVTQCGCISIDAKRQTFPDDFEIENLQNIIKSHIDGTLCENCRDIIEKDIGRNLFYLASLCNTLDLNLYDILLKELERLKMLGKYNLR